MLDEMPSIDTDLIDRSARVHTTLEQVVPHTETGSRFDSSQGQNLAAPTTRTVIASSSRRRSDAS